MPVDTVLSAVADMLPSYEKVRDCVAGEAAIKRKREKYLPMPDPLDKSEYNRSRYDQYLFRASFLNATGRTLRGLVGLVFDKDPAVQAPDALKPVLVDASGSGVPLDQQASTALADNLTVGRGGLLPDYPRTQGPTTVADQQRGNIRPTITLYKAEDIINWRTLTIGAKIWLSLVVLREAYVKEDDEFAQTTGTRHRVLRLRDAGTAKQRYTVQLFTEERPEGEAELTPVDGKGAPLKEIPFQFFGAVDNEPTIDLPPLLDIAEINLKHYLNSADYEESVFICGQPTPVFAGLTKQWVQDVFQTTREDGHGNTVIENKIRLGSRAAVPLPEGGSATLLQAEPNTMASEAMKHKEEQMVSMGAKLLENGGTQQTATEATLDSVMDNSVLGTAARNVAKAYRNALRFAYLFMSGQWVEDEDVIDYELNTDYAAKLLTAADRQAIVSMWVQKAITWTEMRWGLKRAGSAYQDDQEARDEIDSAMEDSIEFEAKAAGALADATGGTDGPPQQPTKGKKAKSGDKQA